ncbi:MAG: RNA polymerase sigma factor [Chloroflexi bacterium]|nr:RNA polymerase sigma factor [Chloroflexota bacterium]
MATSERDLLQRARTFDPQALGEIYDRYSPALFRYAVRLLGNADAAEECVAESFSRFLVALRGGGGPREYMQAYLYRVAHNWITDRWRRAPPPALPLDQVTLDDATDFTSAVADRVAQAQVRAALQCLTEEQRQVVVLKFIEGLENDEIAASLNKPIGAVKSLQHRALAALRRILLHEQDDEQPC